VKKSEYKNACNVVRRGNLSKDHPSYPDQESLREAKLALQGKAPKSEYKQFKASEKSDRIAMYQAEFENQHGHPHMKLAAFQAEQLRQLQAAMTARVFFC